MPHCASCDYWQPQWTPEGEAVADSDEPGACKRRAPVYDMAKRRGDNGVTMWPTTHAASGCGEYERHPTRRLSTK